MQFTYYARVTIFGWLAALVLFLQLPIQLYWFVVHPLIGFWREHPAASFTTGLLLSWPPVTACMVAFRRQLFCPDGPAAWRVVTGVALIGFEVWLFGHLAHDLGMARLVGKTELTGTGSLTRTGVYGRIRHPRYLGSFLAILGACLLAANPVLWAVAAVWTALMLVAIAFEERELHARFGREYEEYAREVPRFLPTWKGLRR